MAQVEINSEDRLKAIRELMSNLVEDEQILANMLENLGRLTPIRANEYQSIEERVTLDKDQIVAQIEAVQKLEKATTDLVNAMKESKGKPAVLQALEKEFNKLGDEFENTLNAQNNIPVSYTHLTLPTICSV